MTMKPVRWALAGFGAGGRVFHGPLIAAAQDLDLVAVVTSNPDRQAEVARLHPGARCISTLAEAAQLGVEGVTITTPTATHVEVATQALELGLAAVVDKPFALTAAAAEALVQVSAATGGTLTTYQNRRWDSDFLTVRRLLDEGALGRVHRFTSRLDRSRPVKAGWHGAGAAEGGGLLLDLGPHLIDQATQLFGPVSTVHAELSTVRPGAGAEDDLELHLLHRSGVRSTLAAGLASPAEGPRFQLNGDRAGFVVHGFDIQEAQLKAGESPATLGDRWGQEPASAEGTLFPVDGESRRVKAERGRWDSFYPAVAAAVRGHGPVPVDPADAVRTAAVIDAARRSAISGVTETV